MSTSKSCTNCPGATDHDTAHCPLGAQGELKPCPFCGGEARLTHDDYVHEDMRPMPVVECTNCHTWVRAESWNNRAALAQPSTAPELVNALRQYQHNDCSGFVFGYDKARVAELEKQKPEWISCEDQMPPANENVLVSYEFTSNDWRIKVGGVDERGNWWVFGASWTPSHWQPLPAAPAQGE